MTYPQAKMAKETVIIGDREVGMELPPYVVAEIGINHNGDLDLARTMVRAAARTGADAVKVQSYQVDDFISNRELTYTYTSQNRTITESQYEMFQRCELSIPSLKEIKSECARNGISFHSTPTSPKGLTLLCDLGVPVIKNGSDYLTDHRLLRCMARSRKPCVLSIGMATLSEIDEAVGIFRAEGNSDLILLHCVSSYPAPMEDLNLSRIPTLSAIFGLPVGFSDHSIGVTAAVVAVSQGACWVEKHFTIDKTLPGPDQASSADEADLAELVQSVHDAYRAIGQSAIVPVSSERVGRDAFRLSCAAAHDLPAGIALGEDDLAFQRPGIGIPPAHSYLLLGRRTIVSLKRGQLIRLEDLQ